VISAIIFSKDRACQLRLLLESIFLNSYKILDDITVIYKTSNADYSKGYEVLKSESLIPKIKVNWVEQNILADDTLKAMYSYCKGLSAFITFFTDDSVFYQNIQDQKFVIESCMHPGSDIGCFSLRMGLNTKEQMHWSTGHTLDIRYARVGNLIKWKHTEYPAHHGYGYPLSLDGHIFRAGEITNLVAQLGGFSSVNGLEGSLSRYKYEILPCMASFVTSSLVTVPINRVQNDCPNIAGQFHGISPEELNRKYLAGEVIDYYSIDFSNINCTHKELAYVCKKR
jgi:hypothetical protein